MLSDIHFSVTEQLLVTLDIPTGEHRVPGDSCALLCDPVPGAAPAIREAAAQGIAE
jgi:hypothetical protein